MRILTVAIGGAAGAVCRYVIAGWIQSLSAGLFPLGTLAVNASGCFVFGLLATAFTGPPAADTYRLLLLVGFCGGYTTFSSFAAETILLLVGGKAALALAYVAASNLLCLAGVWLGLRLTSA